MRPRVAAKTPTGGTNRFRKAATIVQLPTSFQVPQRIFACRVASLSANVRGVSAVTERRRTGFAFRLAHPPCLPPEEARRRGHPENSGAQAQRVGQRHTDVRRSPNNHRHVHGRQLKPSNPVIQRRAMEEMVHG